MADLRAALLSPATALITGVTLSAVAVPFYGWPGLAPLVVAGFAVVAWMHAMVAAVENQWNQLRAINWNTALPTDATERRQFIEELRDNLTGVLRPAVERVGALLRACLLVGAAGLAATFVIRFSAPGLAVRLAAAKAPLISASVLILLLMVSIAWSILRLRKAATAAGDVFAAMDRALDGS